MVVRGIMRSHISVRISCHVSTYPRFTNLLDVIGVLQTVGTLDTAPHKKEVCSFSVNNARLLRPITEQLPIKGVTIIDQSGQTLPVMLWSYNAEGFCARPGTIVAFRHARLQEGRKNTLLFFIFAHRSPFFFWKTPNYYQRPAVKLRLCSQ